MKQKTSSSSDTQSASNILPLKSSSQEVNSNLEARVARLIESGTDVFSAVKGASEAELLYARQRCKGLGWRGEVACDAELLKQCQVLKGGRGKIDLQGVGLCAAIRAQAAKTHDSVDTVRLNIRLFRVFFSSPDTVGTYSNSLDDKGYYHAALKAPQPLKAIRYFAQELASNSDFNVMAAKRWISEQRANRTKAANHIGLSTEEKSMAAFLRRAHNVISNLQRECPDKKFAERVFPSMLDDIEDQQAVMAETHAEDACRLAWEKGHVREAQIAQFTGLSRSDVSMAMNRLSTNQEFWEVEEHTYGKHDKRWQKAGVLLVGDTARRAG